ncbi:hypothetical protein SAMN05421788_106292 [Filimonas lacunae]|uniref:TonB-linked outer membrane protein, SusC/RagA family n=2 Tax=Filimonas lacunae TaxID=477680 RepID=A0A1N7QR07_9BACT|nr:hypothetical protein SAMN05421788_106292 [Filimonas lacunae]
MGRSQVYVRPIHSGLYQQKIKRERPLLSPLDSISLQRSRVLRLKGYPNLYYGQIKSVTIEGDSVATVQNEVYKTLILTGTYLATAEWKQPNRIPALQSEYTQGRSLNEAATWQGPETNELFSYGPSLNTLEFDGSNYPYDVNGRLVRAGSGNGHKAAAYDNSLLRNSFGYSQQLSIKGEVYSGYKIWEFGVAMGHTREQTIIRNNNNYASSLDLFLQRKLHSFSFSGTYSYAQNHQDNTNWNGYLNQVYQQSLLTPASFSNAQGTHYGSIQRSYSNQANNPGYLLEDNNNHSQWMQQTGSFTATFQQNQLKFTFTPSLLNTHQQDKALYKTGSAFWPDGMLTNRNKQVLNYTQQTSAQIPIPIGYNNYHLSQQILFKHLYTHQHTTIQYLPDNITYQYKRPVNELVLNIITELNIQALKMRLITGNNSYSSSTAGKSTFWLPSLSYSIGHDPSRSFYWNVYASYTRFNSELPLSQSVSHYNLLQYNSKDALTYRPVLEINSFRNVGPIEHTEWNTILTAGSNSFLFTATYYIRNIRKDVYPVFNNGSFQLQNMADVRKKGYEITLNYNRYNRYQEKSLHFRANVSFNKYNNVVTRVQENYNFSPLGGFSNIHTALVAGQPFGVITGNDYQRDAANRVVIGNDGFPLSSPGLKVLGNPNPDFVMKSNCSLTWKSLTLLTEWVWKKGGVMWNGTQAVLDYYGRSATTATLRNTTGYVFNGVLQDGSKNAIPVAFNHPSQPIENNRWVRYGQSGVASDYIQKADYLRINRITLSCNPKLLKHKNNKTPLILSLYVHNILIWSPYQGADPLQTLFEQTNTTGLDYFNIPSYRTYGCSLTYQL